MSQKQPPSTPSLTVQIRGLATGGRGVGDVVACEEEPLIGITAFVPFTVPGETVEATVIRREARYVGGRLERVISPSPHRVSPPCPYFGVCGGCDLQHMDYSEQLTAKRDLIEGALRRAKLEDLPVEPVVAGPPYGYRRRVSLHLSEDGSLGFFERGSRDVVAIDRCEISNEALNAAIRRMEEVEKVRGVAGLLVMESGEEGVSATLRVADALSPSLERRVVPMLDGVFERWMFEVKGRVVQSKGPRTLSLRTEAGTFEAAVGSFSQVNWEVNDRLVKHVLDYVQGSGCSTAHDLYAGAGNFTLPLGASGVSALGIESDQRLVQAGSLQARRLGIEHLVLFRLSSVERYLEQSPKPVDIVIADPPRSGLGRLVPRLGYAEHLVLVSCDLAAGVRDISELHRHGWKGRRVTPFDMFSQTGHVELVTEFSRA